MRARGPQRVARTLLISLLLAAVSVATLGIGTSAAQDSTSPEPAPPDSGGTNAGGDTAAIAINTRDDSSVFKLAFQIKRTMQSVVDNTNAAVAISSCEACTTVAISVQVVLVMNDAQVVSPTNLAIAYNIGCSFCETVASAFQYVLGTGGPVHFTPEGNQRLARIRQALRDLGKQDLTPEELQARLDQLMTELQDVLATELQRAQEEAAVGTQPSPAPTESEPAATPTPTGGSTGTGPSDTPQTESPPSTTESSPSP
jgi:putative peptide zinc metalloprotease protein